jgi:hypothetical protein
VIKTENYINFYPDIMLKRGVFMDQANDSDDYELMPKKEIDKLRKEISGMKKNPYGVSDKGQDLQQSIERLNATINKFIAILEDAQQDIIDEYQESKPVEKLNQILDQNETIARALVAINNNLKGTSGLTSLQSSSQSSSQPDDTPYPDFSMPQEKPQSPLQNQQSPQQAPQQFPQQSMPSQQSLQQVSQQFPQQSMPGVQSANINRLQYIQQPQAMAPRQQYGMRPMGQQFNQQPQMPPMNVQQQFPQQQYQQQFGDIPPLDGLSLDNIPPLDAPPNQDVGILPEKKKKFLGLI